MMSRFFICIVSIIILLPHSGNCQSQVSGIVVNSSTKEPIPFVSVAVVGKPIGAVSNQNGEFNLSLKDLEVTDSLGFHFIGFKTITFGYLDLKEDMIVKMEEKVIELDAVSVRAGSFSGRELLNLALAHRDSNYPSFLQTREVFKRNNSATYIDQFDLKLEKSSMPDLDESFAKEIEDSMVRYNRSYTDHLYVLNNSPDDSLPRMGKIRGVKRIQLREEIGGEMEQIEDQLERVFNDNEKGVFWKLKTGPLSVRMNEPDEEDTREQYQTEEMQAMMKRVADSLALIHSESLFTIDKVNLWQWDFIQKSGSYSYTAQGMIPVRGERCYVVNFKGRMGKDYTGKLYISAETYAILRIEYQLKNRKSENGIKLLGIHYNEPDDSGLVLYERDKHGYYLKYSMKSSSTQFGVFRPFELIQKINKPIFNRRLNKVRINIDLLGREESTREVLVISRNPVNQQEFYKIEPLKVKTEKITKYSDDIWKGYSIIEPTKQMKEYKARVNRD